MISSRLLLVPNLVLEYLRRLTMFSLLKGGSFFFSSSSFLGFVVSQAHVVLP